MRVDLQSDSMYLSSLWSWPSFLGTTTLSSTWSRSCLYSALSLSLRILRLNYIFFDFFLSFSRLLDLHPHLSTLSSKQICYDCGVSAPSIFLEGLFVRGRVLLPTAFNGQYDPSLLVDGLRGPCFSIPLQPRLGLLTHFPQQATSYFPCLLCYLLHSLFLSPSPCLFQAIFKS
jgi:hypothetical protein